MRCLSTLLALCLCHIIVAQSARAIQSTKKPVSLRISYLGTIVYPGMTAGMEYPLLEKRYLLQRDSLTSLIKSKQQSLTFGLGGYRHKTFHTNLFLTAGYLWRRTNRHGWFADVEPQLGISRTFVDGTVYTVNQHGEVNQKRMAGDWFLVARFSFSIGKAISLKHDQVSAKVYFRPSLIVLAPYNNFLYGRPSLELGVIYGFKNFWKTTAKEKTIIN